MEAEDILTYIKSPRNGSVCYFSSKLDVPSNVVQNKRVARILFFKIRPSQEILKIRDGTPLEAEEILTYIKSPRNGSVCYFSSKPSQEILKIRDGTPLETEKILTYIKCPRNGSVCYFSSKLDVSSNVVQKKKVARILFFKINKLDVPINVVQKKRVARILFFKIWSSQGILKVRDCTPMEAEEILTYIKSPQNGSVCYFSSKLDVPSDVVQKKILARILFYKIRPSQEILKIHDGTPLEAEEILIYIKSPQNGSVCYFSSKLDIPSNVVQKKRVARILFFKIRPKFVMVPLWSKLDVSSNVVQKKKVAQILFFKIRSSQGILKIRDGAPMEKKKVAWILFFKIKSSQGILNILARIMFYKIRPSQEILKIRDGTPSEAQEILTYIKSPRNGSVCYFSSKLDVPSNVVQKKRVARILFFKIRPSQGILKIRDVARILLAQILFFKIRPSQEILKIPDGTPLEAKEILTYIKIPRNISVCYFSSKLGVPSNVVQKKILARILFFKIRPSQEILKIRDGTPLEAEEILTYIKSPRNRSVCYFSSKLDVPSNVVQKKRVARILFFKIRPSQKILKIRDGTPLRGGGNFYIHKKPSKRIDVPINVVQKKRVARILFFKIWSSQGILKVRDCTPMEAEEILTYIKSPRNGSVCYFSSKLDVPSDVVQKKILARILFYKIRPSQEILKIHDGTPLEAEEILIYIKSPRNGSVCYFSSKLYVSSNVVQKKKVARILFFKIKSSQGILKIRDDVPINVVQKKRVARILFFKIWSSQGILKVRDCTPMEAEEILTYIKSPRNGSVCYFSSKLDVPSDVVQKKILARILFYKIRPSQEILKIHDGTPLEAEEILIYIKSPRNGSVCYFSSKLDIPSNVVQKKRVARILFFKIRPKFVMVPLWRRRKF
ncbi:hypothetical protein OROMI_024843 [Orobanche minor]